MGHAGWNRVIGALGLVLHPQRTLARIMTTPHFYLKVGLSDTESYAFQFSFRTLFWKGATKCYKPSHEQQAALSLYFQKNKIVTTIVETIQ